MKNVLFLSVVVFVFTAISLRSEERPLPRKKLTISFEGVKFTKAVSEICKKANLNYVIGHKPAKFGGKVFASFRDIPAEDILIALAESSGIGIYNTVWEEDDEEREEDQEEDDDNDEIEERRKHAGVYIFHLNNDEEELEEVEKRLRKMDLPDDFLEDIFMLVDEVREAEGEKMDMEKRKAAERFLSIVKGEKNNHPEEEEEEREAHDGEKEVQEVF